MTALNQELPSSVPWLLVAGGFHRRGGMDKANAALATYLADRGIVVHLVAHSVDSKLHARSNITVHLVRRPANSFLLAEPFLGWRGRSVAKHLMATERDVRVVVNGGNSTWPGINWVHCVHHAWRVSDDTAPRWFRAKNRFTKLVARRREATALRKARIIIANSERTRSDLISRLGLSPQMIHTVYLGADSDCRPPSLPERAAARMSLGKPIDRPLAAFVGALSYDNNKGFDILWSAWQRLCARPVWDVDLIVAGTGGAIDKWRRKVAEAGLASRVTFLGFTEPIERLLAASDLLVSPVRYESYGLNVHEALCRGVPALVSASAGVAERYPPELHELLISHPEDVNALVAKLTRWRLSIIAWKDRVQPLAEALRRYTWDDMAREIVSIVTVSRGTFHTSAAFPIEQAPG